MTASAALGVLNPVGEHFSGRNTLFLVFFTWAMRMPNLTEKTLTPVSVGHRHFPAHNFIFQCDVEEVLMSIKS